MVQLLEYVLATRPWSFTAAAIPIFITAAVCKISFFSEVFVRAMLMGITIQAGANLTNTYYDFLNGVDTKDSGERTLVDQKISSTEAMFLSVICYTAGLFAILPYLLTSNNAYLIMIFLIGMLLAYYYTANPIGLKYKALGDITIFLCFGPLLMQFCSILFTGKLNDGLYVYSIPIGMLTELILHVNNVRDIKADTRAGTITLASMIGERLSYLLFLVLLIGSYLSVGYIGFYFNYGCFASIVTIPLALSLNKNYLENKFTDMPGEVAQLHLPFGMLMLGGILLTSKGIFIM